MIDKEETLGRHFLIELGGCSVNLLKYTEDVEPILVEAARAANATILNTHFHQFDPIGVSGVILIAESHMSIHTWPEHEYAGIDIFTCGSDMTPERAVPILEQGFRATHISVEEVDRGIPKE